MPINPSALGDPAPEEQPDDQPQQAEEPVKRTRRSKAQMIADAVVPADDEQVDLRDSGTGAKIQRPWLVALELVRDGKAEFADKAMKHSMQKYDQQKAAPAFESSEGPAPQEPMDAADTVEPSGPTPSVPPEAEVGDEVCVGADVFRVGHGRVLTKSPISVDGEIVHAKQRWQRGPDDEWRSSAAPEKVAVPAAPPTTNGKGDEVEVRTEQLPHTQEAQTDGSIKIGTGVLEKIGMPDYSSFQVGPITISRTVYDDGRRHTVTFDDGREGEVITAAVEGFEVLDNTVEFIAKRFRGQLVSFLEATGSLKQPVS